ncbi:hypothetical protein [Legionella gresilensis]|uniref:hypothetical protein n=1 Tax=Legionella gresilensis TaxID=91823 RepID=UPI001041340B|nr:hypothetical protein [Legionella gresilensis]
MNKRLVWNFEVNLDKPFAVEQLSARAHDLIRWEARYFWPEDKLITLHHLNSNILSFANVQIKERSDSYYLLPQKHLNIKKRREELFYKPLLAQKDRCFGFGKKLSLKSLPPEQTLPGCSSLDIGALLNLLKLHGTIINVDKTALIYKFSCTPTIKLELSRLIINKQVYFSASIEGRSYTLVSKLSQLLLKEQFSCDYVTFLNQLNYD